ncbi:hypothetical protein FB45DRAFT_397075 [Roridomyces roridus]|uniref:Muconate cycloisomerase 1 n=1 Tax=Roridomyces roridus TaxID=1738132 RepID=A0AAD7FUE3_9AGAR|nr:hypothetical protein FB45DRAFT_397075 [Roridomyces roridus]
MDLEPPLQVPLQTAFNATTPVYHILTGSFRSFSLFLLAFNPLQLSIDLVQTIPAFGPHQYIGLGPRLQGQQDARYAYTTSWALPPTLQSWVYEGQPEPRVRFVESAGITATSSYVTVPPPYTHLYAAGGPSAQVHALPAQQAPGFGPHAQELYFVPQDEWETADKTRKALRYGSHGVEFAFPTGGPALAFIPVLGGSTIEIYSRAADGTLIHIDTSPAPQRPGDGAAHEEEDGTRHVKVHPNGRILYCVTEHSNYLDIYRITPPNGATPILTYLDSRSLIPPRLRTEGNTTFRGDTLILAPSTPTHPAPQTIFATTRGAEGSDTRGWVGVWRLDDDGLFMGDAANENNPYMLERWEATTGGGKAHALDVRVKEGEDGELDADGALWVLLTDDSPPHPAVRVLEWDGWLWRGGGTRLREVAAWPAAGSANDEDVEQIQGGSHAVWLD